MLWPSVCSLHYSDYIYRVECKSDVMKIVAHLLVHHVYSSLSLSYSKTFFFWREMLLSLLKPWQGQINLNVSERKPEIFKMLEFLLKYPKLLPFHFKYFIFSFTHICIYLFHRKLLVTIIFS